MPTQVVTAKPFGAMPFGCHWRLSGVFKKTFATPLFIHVWDSDGSIGPSLESLGIKRGECIVAIAGKAVQGSDFDLKAFTEFWFYGEIDAPVKLILQGVDQNESIYREVTVKRIRFPFEPGLEASSLIHHTD